MTVSLSILYTSSLPLFHSVSTVRHGAHSRRTQSDMMHTSARVWPSSIPRIPPHPLIFRREIFTWLFSDIFTFTWLYCTSLARRGHPYFSNWIKLFLDWPTRQLRTAIISDRLCCFFAWIRYYSCTFFKLFVVFLTFWPSDFKTVVFVNRRKPTATCALLHRSPTLSTLGILQRRYNSSQHFKRTLFRST